MIAKQQTLIHSLLLIVIQLQIIRNEQNNQNELQLV